ncbi:glycosyltransferase [Blastococcus sp. SYSU DS0617]
MFIQPHLKYGGAERQTVLIANELVRRGRQCSVVLHERTGGLLAELDPRVTVTDLGFGGHARLLVGATRLKNVLAAMEPSLVIVRLWSSIMMTATVDKVVRKHKYVFYEDLDPTDHASYIPLGRLKQRLIGQIFRRDRKLIANTAHVADSMARVYRLSRTPEVIGCGVNFDAIQVKAAPVRAENDSLHIVTVGSLIERKGILDIVSAMRRLDRPVTWHVVGEGPLLDVVMSVNGIGGRTKVVYHGSRPDPYGVMASAHVMLHAARSESFGVVLVESLAAGTPVLAAAANGPREIAANLGGDARCLRLFEAGNVEALCSALADIEVADLAAPALVRDCAAPYSVERVCQSWERLADDLADDGAK